MVIILNACWKDAVALKLWLEQHLEEFHFVIGQLWVPEVKDEIDACASAIVPGFMIERVVKDDALILHQLLSLVTNAHTSTLDIE